MSRYLILEMGDTTGDGEQFWTERGIVDAPSLEGAVRAYMTGHASEIGGAVFMAVPERSAKRVHVEVQNVRKVSVKAGSDGNA